MALRAVAALGRPQRLATVWSGALAGACLAPSPPQAWLAAGAAAALSLAYLGGAALNDAYDAPLDAVLRPRRPIPAGQVPRSLALALGYGALACFVLACAALAWSRGWRGSVSAAGIALVLSGTVVLYDTAHEGNPAAPALMGVCRGLVYVTAAVVVSGRLSGPPALGAAVLAGYTVGMACACDREEGGSRLWPLLLLLSPFLFTAPLLSGTPGQTCLWFCALLWVCRGILGLLQRDFARAFRTLFCALPLVDAMLISREALRPESWAALAAFPVTYALLRWAPEP